MRAKMQEALGTAIDVYLILILMVLPLYMQDGYMLIGNVKYLFFRNVTLFFIFVTFVMLVVLTAAQGRKGERKGMLSCTDV